MSPTDTDLCPLLSLDIDSPIRTVSVGNILAAAFALLLDSEISTVSGSLLGRGAKLVVVNDSSVKDVKNGGALSIFLHTPLTLPIASEISIRGSVIDRMIGIDLCIGHL